MVNARFLRRHSIIVLLMIVFLLSVFFLFRITQSQQKKPIYVVYTAVFEIDPQVAKSLHTGDALLDARGKENAGEILKITIDDTLGEDVFGVYPLPNRLTVAVTLAGDGLRKNGEGVIGTLTPRVGEAVYLLGATRLEGICVKVRILE